MISHKHKCIFIHIPKVAGQSIELYFLQLLNLTWQDRTPLLLMPNSNPNLGPPRLAHLLASDYVKNHYLSDELFDSYYKFSFVRNPFDRAYSLYKFLGFIEIMTFDDFVKSQLAGNLRQTLFWFVRPQYDFLYDKEGNCLVDFIGKLENINSDFKKVVSRLKLPANDLPKKNVSASSFSFKRKLKIISKNPQFLSALLPRYHIKDARLSDKATDIVKELYHKDFEFFNYSRD